MLPDGWLWLSDYASGDKRLVIGLISGTSADGVDAALVNIIGNEPERVETIAFLTLPYPDEIREAVLRVSHDGDVETLCRLNFLLGEKFAEAALRVTEIAGLSMERIHLIGSHGQTVRHLPPRGGTLQIGEPGIIAYRTGVPVVSHFRGKDMAAGGQGAPLVPLVDRLLLRHNRKNRLTLNIGGIANITVLPAKTSSEEVFAFDTGPGNMLIDGAVRYFSDGRLPFDREGKWARRGRVDRHLLEWLMSHPFLRQPPPKSTGREMFGTPFLREVLSRAERRAMTPCDVVATLTAWTAESIADAIRRFVTPRIGQVDEIILSGGGANNPALMMMLRERLKPAQLRRSDEFGIPADGKEAIAFAVLAHRTAMGLVGNLPSATGASMPVILGSLTLP